MYYTDEQILDIINEVLRTNYDNVFQLIRAEKFDYDEERNFSYNDRKVVLSYYWDELDNEYFIFEIKDLNGNILLTREYKI